MTRSDFPDFEFFFFCNCNPQATECHKTHIHCHLFPSAGGFLSEANLFPIHLKSNLGKGICFNLAKSSSLLSLTFVKGSNKWLLRGHKMHPFKQLHLSLYCSKIPLQSKYLKQSTFLKEKIIECNRALQFRLYFCKGKIFLFNSLFYSPS